MSGRIIHFQIVQKWWPEPQTNDRSYQWLKGSQLKTIIFIFLSSHKRLSVNNRCTHFLSAVCWWVPCVVAIKYNDHYLIYRIKSKYSVIVLVPRWSTKMRLKDCNPFPSVRHHNIYRLLSDIRAKCLLSSLDWDQNFDDDAAPQKWIWCVTPISSRPLLFERMPSD